jgi:hypothetical protein
MTLPPEIGEHEGMYPLVSSIHREGMVITSFNFKKPLKSVQSK